MDWVSALLLLLGLLLVLMATGLPVAFAFLGVNIAGAYIFLGGEVGLDQMARNTMAAVSNFALAPISLFLLMGEILFHTGVAFLAIDAVDRLISRVPGRLSIVSVAGGTIFSSLSGSTIANTAVLGSALLPEMLKRGYHPTIAMGPIMATGSIAMLIPPSALAVLLGSLAGISIAKLLIAGIVPGLMMATAFFAYIICRCSLNPSLAPSYDITELSAKEKWLPFLIYVVPLLGIFVVVVGSILVGWATPTESAALGSVASLVAAAAYGKLNMRKLLRAFLETAKISVMILFIIAASITFSQILAFSGATSGLLRLIDGIGASELVLPARHAGHPALPRRLHGPGEHDHDHPAVLHPAGPVHGPEPAVVRRAHAGGDGNQLHHAALRPPDLRDEGRRAEIDHARPGLCRGDAVHRAGASCWAILIVFPEAATWLATQIRS